MVSQVMDGRQHSAFTLTKRTCLCVGQFLSRKDCQTLQGLPPPAKKTKKHWVLTLWLDRPQSTPWSKKERKLHACCFSSQLLEIFSAQCQMRIILGSAAGSGAAYLSHAAVIVFIVPSFPLSSCTGSPPALRLGLDIDQRPCWSFNV